jgi:hypothetical protein
MRAILDQISTRTFPRLLVSFSQQIFLKRKDAKAVEHFSGLIRPSGTQGATKIVGQDSKCAT